MLEDARASEAWKAPYISYETLTNFFEKKLGSHPVPPRIDAGFLDNYAGSVRPLLIMTLKTLGMIGEKNEVLEPLRLAARDPESRKKVLRSWAEDFYSEQLTLAEQNATAQMLWESFSRRRFQGSTLRKAVVFYLALVEDVGLPNSPHFKPPRQQVPSGSTRSPKPGRAGTATEAIPAADELPLPPLPPQDRGERKVVSFGEAGTVTVTVDVRWLDLPDETFTSLRRVIRELESLEIAEPGDEDEEES